MQNEKDLNACTRVHNYPNNYSDFQTQLGDVGQSQRNENPPEGEAVLMLISNLQTPVSIYLSFL